VSELLTSFSGLNRTFFSCTTTSVVW